MATYCCARVRDNMTFFPVFDDCKHFATVTASDGKGYCKLHDPDLQSRHEKERHARDLRWEQDLCRKEACAGLTNEQLVQLGKIDRQTVGDFIMMNHRKSAMGRSRDFGTGAGKGDASRIDDQQTFAENLGEVKFDGVTGLRKVGAAKFVKVYGAKKAPAGHQYDFATGAWVPLPPADVFAETDGEWVPAGSIHQTAVTPTNDLLRD